MCRLLRWQDSTRTLEGINMSCACPPAQQPPFLYPSPLSAYHHKKAPPSLLPGSLSHNSSVPLATAIGVDGVHRRVLLPIDCQALDGAPAVVIGQQLEL